MLVKNNRIADRFTYISLLRTGADFFQVDGDLYGTVDPTSGWATIPRTFKPLSVLRFLLVRRLYIIGTE